MPGPEPVIKPHQKLPAAEPAECFSLPFPGRNSEIAFNIRAPLPTDELRVIFESCLAHLPEHELARAVLPPFSFLEKHFYSLPGTPAEKAAAALKNPEVLLDLTKNILPSLKADHASRIKMVSAIKEPLEQVWPAMQKACTEGWFKLFPVVNIMPVSFGWGGTFETEYPERGMIWVKAEDAPTAEKAEEIKLTTLHLLVHLGVHEELCLKNSLSHEESEQAVYFLCSRYFKIPGYPSLNIATKTEGALAAWLEQKDSWRSRLFSRRSPVSFLSDRQSY